MSIASPLQRSAPPMDGPRLLAFSVALVMVYLLGAALTAGGPPGAAVPLWHPQAGIAVLAMVAGGRLFAPAAAVAIFVAEVVVYGAPGSGGSFALASAAEAAGLVAVAAWLQPRAASAVDRFAARKGRASLAMVVLLLGLAAALRMGVFAADGLIAPAAWLRTTAHHATADLLGVLAVLPLIALSRTQAGLMWIRAPHLVRDTLFAAALAVSLPSLAATLSGRPFVQWGFIAFVPLIALAVSHRTAGMALLLPLLYALLTVSAGIGLATPLPELQALMLALGIIGLGVAALGEQRAREIEELAARDARLREQQRTIDQNQRTAAASEMASALAHELNQPLSALAGYAAAARALMAQSAPDNTRLQDIVLKLGVEATRAGAFVRRMRDFFRSGSFVLEPHPVAALVATVSEPLAARMAAHGIVFMARIDPAIGNALLDRLQIEVVLHNLVSNAIDAVKSRAAPRRIWIEATVGDADTVVIDVLDNGKGIPLEQRGALFDPLQTTKVDGLGLGLSICRTIAEGHGGSLVALRYADPTCFRLILPADA